MLAMMQQQMHQVQMIVSIVIFCVSSTFRQASNVGNFGNGRGWQRVGGQGTLGVVNGRLFPFA